MNYFENQIQSAERIRGRFLNLIPPLSTMVYSQKLQKVVLAQSFLPLHYRLLKYGFLKFPQILISSKELEETLIIPLLKELCLCPSILKSRYKLNSSRVLLQFTSQLFSDPTSSQSPSQSDNYLFNLGFFFPVLNNQMGTPFTLINPTALIKFSRSNIPQNLLELTNVLQLKCSECKNYIADDSYYKIKQHKLTPPKLLNYICCSYCYIDHQQLGNQLQVNSKMLRKKQVPQSAKKRNYINESTLQRYDTLSEIKNQISANAQSAHILDQNNQQHLVIKRFNQFFEKELIPQCLAQYKRNKKNQQFSSDLEALKEAMEQQGIPLGVILLVKQQLDKKIVFKIQECIWRESVKATKEIARNPEAFQQSVKDWDSQTLISINRRIDRVYGSTFQEQLIEEFNPKPMPDKDSMSEVEIIQGDTKQVA